MAHEIYKGNFAGVTPGWHRIGHPLKPGTTAEEAMEIAGQKDWDVKALPLDVVLSPALEIDTKGMHILVRKEGDGIQVASDQLVEKAYTPVNNEEIFGPMVELMAGEKLEVDCAGVLGRLGNRAFMTFSAGNVTVAGNEAYQQYLVAVANHSGKDAIHLLPTGIRVVCANTERAALGSAKAKVTILHNRSSIDAFYDDAESGRRVLGLAEHYRRNLERMSEEMQQVRFNGPMVAELVRQYHGSMGKADTDRKATIQQNAVQRLKDSLYLEFQRADQLAQEVSLWTIKQGISTYVQHAARGGEVMRANRSMKIALGEQPEMMAHLNRIAADVAVKLDITGAEKTGRAVQWMGVSA